MATTRKSSIVQVHRVNDGVTRVDDDTIRRLSASQPGIAHDFNEAKAATAGEHELTIRDAIKLYPKAIVFSLIFSTAVVMEGYDLSLMGSFFGLPPFRNFYGTEDDPDGGRQISATWQSGILNGTQVCSMNQLRSAPAHRLAGWFHHRPVAERYHLGSIRLQKDHVRFTGADDYVYLLAGAGAQHPDHPRRRHSVRPALGRFPDDHGHVRLRCHPDGVAAVPHLLRQPVLGLWSIYRGRRPTRHGPPEGSAGLPASVRTPVDLAAADSDRGVFGPRVAVVAGPPRPV